jgi:O-antigen ligase
VYLLFVISSIIILFLAIKSVPKGMGLLLVLLAYSSFESVIPLHLGLVKGISVLNILVATSGLLVLSRVNQGFRIPKILGVWILFYFMIAILSGVNQNNSNNIELIIFWKFLISQVIIILYVSSAVFDAARINRFFTVYFWLIVGFSILTIVGWFFNFDESVASRIDKGRLIGPFGESNWTGVFIAATSFIGIWRLGKEKHLTKKLLFFGGCIILWLVLLATASRAGIFAATFALLVFVFRRYQISISKMFGTIILLSLLVYVVIQLLPNDFIVSLQSRILVEGDANLYSSGRISLWEYAWMSFKEKPLFGNGYNGYKYWMLSNGISSDKAAHNTYFTYFCDYGIFTGLTFLFMISKSIRFFHKKKLFLMNMIFIIICFGYLTFDYFDNTFLIIITGLGLNLQRLSIN